jgi:hypothetical protein
LSNGNIISDFHPRMLGLTVDGSQLSQAVAYFVALLSSRRL